MNIKKIITAILLVSDGPMHHSYFQETFDIGHDELLNVYSEINNDLENLNFGFARRIFRAEGLKEARH